MELDNFGGLEHSAVLHTLPLSGSLNRCVCGFAPYGRSTQIPSLRSGTSHTPQTLGDIAIFKGEYEI